MQKVPRAYLRIIRARVAESQQAGRGPAQPRGEEERMSERQKEIARRRQRKETAQKARKRAAIAAAKKTAKKA